MQYNKWHINYTLLCYNLRFFSITLRDRQKQFENMGLTYVIRVIMAIKPVRKLKYKLSCNMGAPIRSRIMKSL